MKKRVLISVDHMYGMGGTAIALIMALKATLSEMNYQVHEHATPDAPRAMLQALMFFAENASIGNSFWFDFGSELLTKARVCAEIIQQWTTPLGVHDGLVIFCKNMNGTTIHGLLRNPTWHEDGMDDLESRMRCGVAFGGEHVSPDLNILLDDTSENVMPMYQRSIRELIEQIKDPAAKENMRVFFEKIDFISQREAYLNEFALMDSEKTLILDAGMSIEVLADQVMKRMRKMLV